MQEATESTQRYQCGCGKAYTSYPAYSTHKRLKHGNQSVTGTHLPRQYAPKRGRPSFSLPSHSPLHPSFQALSVPELALLRLEERFGQIMSEPQSEGSLFVFEGGRERHQLFSKGEGQWAKGVEEFGEVLVGHLREQIGRPVSKLLLELTAFCLKEKEGSEVSPESFNRFVSEGGGRKRVDELSREVGKPLAFMLEIIVALSEYLCAVGLSPSVVSLK